MKLRTRLILAFLLLSVVPLGAVTVYSYVNNVRTLEEAAAREADLLASELSARMQFITAELSSRVGQLMDMPAQAVPVQNAQPPLLVQLASTYTTPKAVATLLRDEFTFKRDEELFGETDHWQSPEEFLKRKAGDCEDYALLAQAILRLNGIEAYVVSLFGREGYAHTVCVFKDERGRYNLIDVDKIRYPKTTSLEALASWLYPAWTSGGVVEQAGLRGRMIQRITNPHPVSPLAFADPWSGPTANF